MLWTGDHDHPKADTSVPVLVYDQRYEQHQSLQAEEAELLMDFPAGSTSGHAVPQIERLRALGDSRDVRTFLTLNRFSRHATIRVDGPLSVNSLSLQSSGNSAKQTLLAARAKGGPDAIVQLLAELTKEEQLLLFFFSKLCQELSYVATAEAVLDSGSSQHLHNQVQVTKVTQNRLGHKAMVIFHSQRTILSLDKIGHLMCGTRTSSIQLLWTYCLVRSGWSFYFESADNY